MSCVLQAEMNKDKDCYVGVNRVRKMLVKVRRRCLGWEAERDPLGRAGGERISQILRNDSYSLKTI
jgi:hypothetical protein